MANSEISQQYQTLASLRVLDKELRRVQLGIQKVPTEKAILEQELTKEKERFSKLKEASEASSKKLRELESELRTKEADLLKAQGKMMEVKTNEEYRAAMTQNEGLKENIAKLEEQILNLMSQVEVDRNQFKAVETEFKTFEANYKAKVKVLDEEQAELEKERSGVNEKRSSLVSQLSGKLASTYNILANSDRLDGKFIVLAKDGRCTGCQVKVRPQAYNEIVGQTTFHTCGNCTRILTIPLESDSTEILH